MTYKVSVIVPVYNVEKYLYRCLNSLVNQTLTEIQIIVINDGATDQSQDIINSFVINYPTKVFSYIKSNGGLGDARNYGLQFVKSNYLGFVDSDDYVEFDMYEQLFDKIQTENAEIAICDIEYEWENSVRRNVLKGFKKANNLKIIESLFLSPLFAWNKLYLFSLFENLDLRYPQRLWYEDIPVTIPFFASINKVAYVEIVLIHYMQRENSIMASYDNIKIFDIFDILEITEKRLKDLDNYDKLESEIEFLYIEQLLLFGAFRFYKSKFADELIQKSLSLMKVKYKDWKSNKYIKTLPFRYRVYLTTLNGFTYRIYKMYVKIMQK
jgi:glycosyltransferase involved in cell wall biosynthesis